jgi:hypothetical protein
MSNKIFYMNPYLQKCFRLFIVLIALLPAASVKAQNGPPLQWELVNSFRFINDREVIDDLRDVYERLTRDNKKTAYDLDRELQRIADDAVDKAREAERIRLGCDNKKSERDKRKCLEETKKPYPGWFARLAVNNYAKTCWNSETRQFRNDGECKDYVHPSVHTVRVWVSDSQLLGGQTPQWFMNNQPLTKFKNCADKYQRGICIEFDVEYDRAELKPTEIAVKFPNSSLTIAPLQVLVKDKLIVGLGDSYAAGEGNPDLPAQFTEGNKDPDVLLTLPFKITPRKDTNPDVGWLDRRCHRSMYSYQFKTALQLALANPREAVTYVSYSCSGASTGEIINEEQKAIEGGGELPAQLEALRGVLADGKNPVRKIDYLLLSTGGNDVGFSKFVAYIVASKGTRWLIAHGINEESLKKSKEQFQEKLLTGTDKDNGNYVRLHNALLNAKTGVEIKGCEPGKPCERILLTPYPDILNDEHGEVCKANRQEFDFPFKKDKERAKRIRRLTDYVFPAIREVQQDPKIKHELGWTVVTGHFNDFLEHGFCARGAQGPSRTGEEFVIPTLHRHGVWKRFDPRDYRAYETRQRWIRLPVDSKLTTDQMHLVLKTLNQDFFLEDDRSNIMHPTAEGLSKMADANLTEIERIESKPH